LEEVATEEQNALSYSCVLKTISVTKDGTRNQRLEEVRSFFYGAAIKRRAEEAAETASPLAAARSLFQN